MAWDLLDLNLVSTNVTGALLNQLLGNALFLESDKAEVLGRVIFFPVYGPDNLTDIAELTEVLLNLALSHPGVGKLTHVDFARLGVKLLY